MTVITRIFFHWYEIEAILTFEKDNPDCEKYLKILTVSFTSYLQVTAIIIEKEKEKEKYED